MAQGMKGVMRVAHGEALAVEIVLVGAFAARCRLAALASGCACEEVACVAIVVATMAVVGMMAEMMMVAHEASCH
ncbi:hypothetical protein [Paraburkholderia sp. Ac-20340]|uniref:hypothetical protein n=1 Tax=Paraburkholderia sp. Ac-20340 TaxID=2703888 RepID=UPI001F11B0E4|nr:hypothetical protein [Paraburkholderia sp. Ac-20340]